MTTARRLHCPNCGYECGVRSDAVTNCGHCDTPLRPGWPSLLSEYSSIVVLKCEDGERQLKFSTVSGVGFGRFQVDSSLTLVFDDPYDVRTWADELRSLADAMQARMDPFSDVSVEQLRWYVACCRESDDMHDRVLAQLEATTSPEPRHAVSCMTRDELIAEATSYNEDAVNAARRLKDSWADPQAIGWPRH